MAKTVRLTDKEEQLLIETALKINRELVKMGKMPMKDTELFHEIIESTLINGIIELSRDGKIKIHSA